MIDKIFKHDKSQLVVYANGTANMWTNNWAASWSIDDCCVLIDMYRNSLIEEDTNYFSHDELIMLSEVYL